MNANEATGIRELTEMNGELRELTVDEENMVAGGYGEYSYSILNIHFRGNSTYGCMSWDDGIGRTAYCW